MSSSCTADRTVVDRHHRAVLSSPETKQEFDLANSGVSRRRDVQSSFAGDLPDDALATMGYHAAERLGDSCTRSPSFAYFAALNL
jgi:hypothetical protein